jgi:hypothetical protein
MKKVLFLAGTYPQKTNPEQAASLNIYTNIETFLNERNYQCFFLRVSLSNKNKLEKKIDLNDINFKILKKKGLNYIGNLEIKKKFSFESLFSYPGCAYSKEFKYFVNFKKFDYIFPIWSEFCIGIIKDIPAKKFSIVGDIFLFQHTRWIKNHFYNLNNFLDLSKLFIFFFGLVKYFFLKYMTKNLIKNINGFVMINYKNYKLFKKFNKNVFYIPNSWTTFNYKKNYKDKNNYNIIDIVLSVGKFAQTGNVFGLNYFFNKVYPILKRNIAFNNYKINIYGDDFKNFPSNLINKIDNNVIFHGYVKDINSELNKSFIMLNLNSSDNNFVISNTRILHAWSQGLCVITHKNQKNSMPELIHKKNIILANSDEEFIEYINFLFFNPDIRINLIKNSLKTLKKYFDAKNNSNYVKDKFKKTFNVV